MKKVLKLENELIKLLPNAEQIWIAAAAFSDYGFDLIQNHISKNAKQYYLLGINLPTPPSVIRKVKEIQEESKIEGKVYLKENQFFHPKLYLLKIGDKLVGFLGSGNCTRGGLKDNIELNLKITSESFCQDLLENYFLTYFKLGTKITNSFIEDYELIFARRNKRMDEDKEDLKILIPSKNKINLSSIDFSDQFFQYRHFAAFEGTKPYSDGTAENQERLEVKQRLLELHDQLLPKIKEKGWDLHPHHKDDHIISSHTHSSWTSEALTALWLHYGKSSNELKKYQKIYGEHQTSLYHMRLQIIIHVDNLGIWCRVGKNNGSIIDREYFKKKMKNKEYREKFFILCENLGEEYWIEVNGHKKFIPSFSTGDELAKFTNQDRTNYYFIIGKSFSPADESISTVNIVDTVLSEFEKLYAVYEHIRHRF